MAGKKKVGKRRVKHTKHHTRIMPEHMLAKTLRKEGKRKAVRRKRT